MARKGLTQKQFDAIKWEKGMRVRYRSWYSRAEGIANIKYIHFEDGFIGVKDSTYDAEPDSFELWPREIIEVFPPAR